MSKRLRETNDYSYFEILQSQQCYTIKDSSSHCSVVSGFPTGLEIGDYLRRIYSILQETILNDLKRLITPWIRDWEGEYVDILSLFNVLVRLAAKNIEFQHQLMTIFGNVDIAALIRPFNYSRKYLFYVPTQSEYISIANLFSLAASLIETFYRRFNSFSFELFSRSLSSLKRLGEQHKLDEENKRQEQQYDLSQSLEQGEVLEPLSYFTPLSSSQQYPSGSAQYLYDNRKFPSLSQGNSHPNSSLSSSYAHLTLREEPDVRRARINSLLKNGYSFNALQQNGITIEELRLTGLSAFDLRKEGFSIEQTLKIGFSLEEIKMAGFPTVQFRNAKIKLTELRRIGFSLDELKRCGYSASELKTAGFSVKELSECFSASQMRKACSLQELLDIGYQVGQLRAAQFPIPELLNAGITLSQLRMGGFTASSLKHTSVATLAELKEAGFTATNLKEAGYGLQELKDVGFTPSQLRGAKFTIEELKEVGCTPVQLRAAGFTAQELKIALTCTEMRDAGYTPSQLKAVGYSAIELIEVGYELNQLLIAGFSAEDIRESYD